MVDKRSRVQLAGLKVGERIKKNKTKSKLNFVLIEMNET